MTLSLTNNFPAATSGLKKLLKNLDLKDSFGSLVDVAKQIKDLDKIKDYVEKLQLKGLESNANDKATSRI